MQENIDKIENVNDTYKNGEVTIIVSHNPNGKSFQEGLEEYFRCCLQKEFPGLYD